MRSFYRLYQHRDKFNEEQLPQDLLAYCFEHIYQNKVRSRFIRDFNIEKSTVGFFWNMSPADLEMFSELRSLNKFHEKQIIETENRLKQMIEIYKRLVSDN